MLGLTSKGHFFEKSASSKTLIGEDVACAPRAELK